METTPNAQGSRAQPALRPDDGRLVRGRRSRDRIRAAARELFRERGFDKTTLRAIAERAGMGTSSIYRHIQAKEELLVEELWDLQTRAWTELRQRDDGKGATRTRLHAFLDEEHRLLAAEPDFTTIALRATTHPEARVARRVLALQDRTVGFIAEILMQGRVRKELRRDADLLAAASTITHTMNGARIAWANGILGAEACRSAIGAAVDLLFEGIEAPAR